MEIQDCRLLKLFTSLINLYQNTTSVESLFAVEANGGPAKCDVGVVQRTPFPPLKTSQNGGKEVLGYDSS